MAEHARFSPSSFHRLMRCGGSHELAARYPDDDSPASREGTAAHWVAQRLLQDGEVIQVDTSAPNGETVTMEMVEGAQVYADHVRSITTHPIVEQPVSCSSVHADCWGTPDARATAGDDLHLWDYKFGHLYVDEFENWQLLAYVSDLVEAVSGQIHMHIVQPRAYGTKAVRTWTIDRAGIGLYVERLRQRIVAIDRGELGCTVSEQCHYCPARRGCRALETFAQIAMDFAGQRVALDLPPSAAAIELRMIEALTARMQDRADGLREQLTAELKRGERVPGYELAPSYGREGWSVDHAQVVALGEAFGVDLAAPVKAISPAQARKVFPVIPMLDAMTGRSSSLKLQQTDTKNIRRVFGG